MSEYHERRRIARDFPGHPVPAHPRTARTDDYERAQVRAAGRLAERATRVPRETSRQLYQVRATMEHERRRLTRERRDLERALRPPRRWPWALLAAAVALALAAWLLAGCGAPPLPRVEGQLAQVYQLPSGATRVNLTLYAVERTAVEVNLSQVVLRADNGTNWAGPAEKAQTLVPGESLPIQVDGMLPEGVAVESVVVAIPGYEVLTLPVEDHHRRGPGPGAP